MLASAPAGERTIVRRGADPLTDVRGSARVDGAEPLNGVRGSDLAELSTEEQLGRVVLPLRDPRELTLRLDPAIDAIPLTVNDAAPVRAIGDEDSFWVHDTSTNTTAEVTAQLVYSTPVAYVWVEDGQRFNRDAIVKSIDRFSSTTYPNEVNVFGSEWYPGVDNDPRLHILYNTAMGSGVAGYFYSADEYSRLANPYSNEREMFYINLDPLNQSQNYTFHETTLAHELQHMIHWRQDRGEDLWVNEGLSEYAQEVGEFGADMMFVTGFAAAPDLQLTTWNPEPGSNGPHYGSAYLFMAYLAQRFGQPIITALVAAPENGLAGVDAALRKVSATGDAGVTAAEVFADWVVANYARQPHALGTQGVYGYQGLNVPVFAPAAAHDIYPLGPQNGQVFNYATDYIELAGEGDVTFVFDGQAETRLADTDVPADRRVWWSNRGDDANPRLTQRFDLSNVAVGTPVTMTASMWWDFEPDYDYGYVMASRDGEHWDLLSSQRMSMENPSGNALGPGYTGSSGDAAGDPSKWVSEHFDLSPYAGDPVWVQFSYVTDDAVNLAGWLVDDIRVEDGARGDSLTDVRGSEADWVSEGWLLTDNRLAQPWLVQVMEFDGDQLTAVRRVPVDADGTGSIDIEKLGAGRYAVVAISGVAPVTTVPAKYTYEVNQK